MIPLTEAEIRTSFVNCSQGEAKRLRIPVGVVDTAWDTLDFLGWRDPRAPAAAHLVTEFRGRLTGLVMRMSTDRRATGRQNMCALCGTVHSTTDVALMVAPRPGASGRNGNTVGTYLCTDLACSLYARRLKQPDRVQPVETLSTEARVERLRTNLETFLRRVVDEA
jgi:hypothetical protein